MGAAAAGKEDWDDWDTDSAPTKPKEAKAEKAPKEGKTPKAAKEGKSKKGDKAPKAPKEAKEGKEAKAEKAPKEGKAPKAEKGEKPASKGDRVTITGVRVGDLLVIRKAFGGTDQGLNKKHMGPAGLVYDFKVAGYAAPYASKKDVAAALGLSGYKLTIGEDDVPVKAAKEGKAPKAATTTIANPKAAKPAAGASGADVKAIRLAIKTAKQEAAAAVKALGVTLVGLFQQLEAAVK